MAQGIELYDRRWSLTVGNRQWTDLRISFEINKTLKKHPNPAVITLYNLARETRDSFDRDDEVRLVAGYAQGSSLVFAGQVVECTSQRDGTDWATVLVCHDGATAWSRTVRSAYSKGASVATIAKSIAQTMGLEMPTATASTLAGLQLRGPLVMATYANRALSTLLGAFGLGWSIQDGALVVLETGGALANEAIVLSPDSGLVGSPERISTRRIAGTAKTKVTRSRVTTLLQGTIRPGQRVIVDSDTLKGTFRVDEVMHKGDSHGSEWYSETVLSALGA